MIARVALTLLFLSLLSGTARASATIALYGERGDWITQGGSQDFPVSYVFGLEDGDRVTVRGTAAGVSASGETGAFPDEDWYSVALAPPEGATLQPGVYEDAHRFATASDPQIDVTGDGHGCNGTLGRFVILDIHYADDGAVDRLWAVFEQHCEWLPPAAFGEIRFGYPPPTSGVEVVPQALRWPETEIGLGDPLPVWVRATGPDQVLDDVSSDSDDFAFDAEDCAGDALSETEPCPVWVLFDPVDVGEAAGALSLSVAGGGTQDISLAGTAIARTRVALRSHGSGSGLGGSVEEDLVSPAVEVTATGDATGLTLDATFDYNQHWQVRIAPPPGGRLEPGLYPAARAVGEAGDHPALTVARAATQCANPQGWYSIDQAQYAPDGTVQSLSVAFDESCGSAGSGVTGIIDYHATRPPLSFQDLKAPVVAPEAPAPTPPPTTSTSRPTRPPVIPTRPAKPPVVTLPPSNPPPQVPAASPPTYTQCRGHWSVAGPRLGTAGRDVLRGIPGPNVISAGPGDDVLIGSFMSDCLVAGSGADRVMGGSGPDVLLGGAGDDLLVAGLGKDFVDCGRGHDVAWLDRRDTARHCETVHRVQ